MPDVVLVRKAYPNVRKRMTKRYWKLKELEKEKIDEENFWADKKKAKKEGQKYENQRVLDEKMFHQDIEEIPEMREEI